MNKYEIPNKIKVGGQEINIRIIDRCDDNCLGMSKVAEGRIEIATMYNKDSVVSESCQMNTFYHELVHAILYTMGETELNNNEKFVCTFSSLLNEALCSAEYNQKKILQ